MYVFPEESDVFDAILIQTKRGVPYPERPDDAAVVLYQGWDDPADYHEGDWWQQEGRQRRRGPLSLLRGAR